MGNSCEHLVHSRYLQLGLQPTAGHRSPGQGPPGRSPAVGTYEGWVTSHGVCGHLLDSLSAWGHSVTLWKPEQARFGQFYGIMFFWKASPQTEGRRHAHPLIKTSPGILKSKCYDQSGALENLEGRFSVLAARRYVSVYTLR